MGAKALTWDEAMAQRAALLEICREFVARVEKGEVRSRYTYQKMKDVLEEIDGR